MRGGSVHRHMKKMKMHVSKPFALSIRNHDFIAYHELGTQHALLLTIV
jgi:hypothetical protein